MIAFHVLIFIFSVAFVKNEKIPIIFIPDFGSSIIEARLNRNESSSIFCSSISDWFELWPSTLYSIFGGYCFANNFKLVFDPISHSMVTPPGVETRVSESPGTCSSEQNWIVDYIFKRNSCRQMINTLKKLGYDESQIYTVNYDYRVIGDTREMVRFFTNIDNIINKLILKDSKVMIISLGLGGPLVSHYLRMKSLYWKKNHIDSWYSINGQFGGTLSFAASLLLGTDSFTPFHVSKRYLYELLISFPTIYFYFPSPQVFKDEKLVYIPNSITINAQNLRNYITENHSHEAQKIFPFIKDIFVNDNPGIPVACVHTTGYMSISGIILKGVDNPNYHNVNLTNGDGFAPLKSLQACLLWDKNKFSDFEHFEIKNPTNQNIYSLPNLQNHLRKFIHRREILRAEQLLNN